MNQFGLLPNTLCDSEAEILSVCNHPNIIKVYHSIKNQEKTTVALIMEYFEVDIPDCRKVLVSCSEERILFFIYQVCQVLLHLKQKNILHRDIKPTNILLETNGELKIVDFGFAKFTDH